MKRKYMLVCILAAAAVAATCGCARIGRSNDTGTASGGSTVSNTGEATATASDSGSQNTPAADTAPAADPAPAADTAPAPDAAPAADATPAAENASAEQDAEASYEEANQSGEGAGGETLTSDWDGVFGNASGETLTISTVDEYTLSFAFSVSGISGTAGMEGNEAIYNGDDGNQVIFSLSGTTIEVSVLNADGESEPATFSGTFTMQ